MDYTSQVIEKLKTMINRPICIHGCVESGELFVSIFGVEYLQRSSYLDIIMDIEDDIVADNLYMITPLFYTVKETAQYYPARYLEYLQMLGTFKCERRRKEESYQTETQTKYSATSLELSAAA